MRVLCGSKAREARHGGRAYAGTCRAICTFQLVKKHGGSARDYALDVWFLLVFGARCAHSERLAGARLAVCEDGDIVALNEGCDALLDVVEDAFLVDVLAKNAVENEELPAIGGVDGDLLA